MRTFSALLTAAVLLAAALITPTSQAAQIGTVSGATAAAQLQLGMSSSQTPASAKTQLTYLRVAAAGSTTGYSRDLFPHWRDASTYGWPVYPNDACNARNAALYRDGRNVYVPSTCTNLTGTWIDPYSGNVFNAASDIDIDHVVPLANAWRSGASTWTTAKRTQFANEPLVLVSAWDYLNQQKGDKGPEAWKPQNTAAHCLYATRWVHIKAKYALSITSSEKSALQSMLGTCA